MKKVLTPKELAEAIGVSESSLRRWVDSGQISTFRTVGGHRRIPLGEAIRFIRETRARLARPEILGLPEPLKATEEATATGNAEERLLDGFMKGDEGAVRRLLSNMYLQGTSLSALCDGPLRGALQKVGEIWQHDEKGILVEHRAVDICLGALNELRRMVPPVPTDAPLAIGGAPEGDPYLLPSLSAALVLLDAGYRTMNFGPNTPLGLLGAAAKEQGAGLVWLSISAPLPKDRLVSGIQELAEQIRAFGARLVVGGRGAAPVVRDLFRVQAVDSLANLIKFAQEILPRNNLT